MAGSNPADRIIWREWREHSRIGLRRRKRIGTAPRGREFQPGQRFGLLHRGGDAIDHGNAEFGRELAREIGHPGATQHDCLRALVQRQRDLGIEFFFRAGAGLFDVEHRDIAGADPRPFGKTVAAHQLFQRHDRARQRGDDGDAFGNCPAVTSAASQIPITGKRTRRSRGVEPGIVETGDDAGIGVGGVQHRTYQAGNGKGLVIETFDRDRPHRRGHGHDFAAWGCYSARRGADGLGHRHGGIRIDDQNFCHMPPSQKNIVARMERSAIRGKVSSYPDVPDYASLHPGYGKRRTGGLEAVFIHFTWPDPRRGSRFGGGGAMPVHPGQARARGLLSTPGKRTRRETQARTHRGHLDDRIAAANAAGRRRALQEHARHLPGMLSAGALFLERQLPARFSANEARPSDASSVRRRAECILTSRT